MELRHLRYFVAVAEELHFGRAAARLHIVQPALSKQIAQLERELGVRLFDRSKRRVAITAAGAAFYAEVRIILQRAEKAMETARLTAQGEVGTLDIGFIGPAMWSVLPGILSAHQASHPGIRFRLHELSSAVQIKQLLDGVLDVGLVRMPLQEEQLVFQTVHREPLLLTLPRGHREARHRVVDLGQCAHEPFVLVPRASEPGFYDRCIALCQLHGFSPTVVQEGNSAAAVMGMVTTGLGISLSPSSILAIPLRGIVSKPIAPPTIELELAVARRDEEPSRALAGFLEAFSEIGG